MWVLLLQLASSSLFETYTGQEKQSAVIFEAFVPFFAKAAEVFRPIRRCFAYIVQKYYVENSAGDEAIASVLQTLNCFVVEKLSLVSSHLHIKVSCSLYQKFTCVRHLLHALLH